MTSNQTTDNQRPNQTGSACPLYSSAPIARIVRGRETGINNRFLVQYADGQTLEIRLRPDSTDERITALATDERFVS
jgi:hypothetical protein